MNVLVIEFYQNCGNALLLIVLYIFFAAFQLFAIFSSNVSIFTTICSNQILTWKLHEILTASMESHIARTLVLFFFHDCFFSAFQLFAPFSSNISISYHIFKPDLQAGKF